MSTGNSGTFGTKLGKPILYQEDFRGVTLCYPCWQLEHFHRDVISNRLVCQCKLGMCECPCSKQESDRAELNFAKRRAKKENAKAQTHILDSGCGTIEVK